MASRMLETVEKVEAQIAPLLKGHSPEVQGAVLVSLMATFLLGFHGKDRRRRREDILQLHREVVQELVDGADAS